ncbi:hypothetical protein [Microvirga sp. G4-2]|uniref:hypothetical protein n=1 Tax=Microvirga sp. G4-2 TaxID=3434467 RepID=UPI0040443A60
MDLYQHREQLAKIDQHLGECERRVGDQAAYVEQLRKDSQETALAMRLLQAFEQTLEQLHIRRQLILGTITRKSTLPWT